MAGCRARLKEADGAANAILKAYDAIGMRVSYCYAVRDQNRLVYEADEKFVARLPAELQPPMNAHFGRFKMTVPEYMTLFESLFAQHAGNGRAQDPAGAGQLPLVRRRGAGDHRRDCAQA